MNKKNLATLYAHPEVVLPVKLFHFTQDSTTLYTAIIPDQLLPYSNVDNIEIILECNIYKDFRSKNPIRTFSSTHKVNKAQWQQPLFIAQNFFSDTLKQAVLMLKIGTNQSPKALQTVATLNKSDFNSEQYYKLVHPRTGKTYLTPFLQPYDSVQIIALYAALIDKFKVRISSKTSPLPNPPYALTGNANYAFTTDTVFTLPVNGFFVAQKTGTYQIFNNLDPNQGLMAYQWGKNFPEAVEPTTKLAALKYLISPLAWDSIAALPNAAMVWDKFWLKQAKTTTNAELLKQTFADRVTYANIAFTALTQGWQTDRGMIYVVFGPPDQVYIDHQHENWLYNFRDQTVQFWFVKIPNPFTTNHYTLEREPQLEQPWNAKINSWLQGDPFTRKGLSR